MTGVTGFKYDIFISYAHVDNEMAFNQKDPYVEQFYKNLQLILTKRFGRPNMVTTWIDHKKLVGNTVFDKSIEDNLKNSAIMICLDSKPYQSSDYCQKELKMFYDKANQEEQGLIIGYESRIVHVLLNNIPFAKWSKEFRGTSGFPFHDSTDDQNLGDPFETTTEEYKKSMLKLRDALIPLLESFQINPTSTEVFKKLDEKEKDEKFCIYLAEVSDPLRSARKRIATELENKDFKIISGPPPPAEAEEHEKSTKEAITKSQLSIHLLDQYAGREIVGDSNNSYPKKQAEIGFQLTVPQMIWMPSSIDFEEIEEPYYKDFLTAIDEGSNLKKIFEFIKGSKSTLTQEIIAYAEQLVKKQEIQIKQHGKLSVLLDTHFADQKYAYSLSQAMLDNDIQPYVNPQEDDPLKNMNILGDRMSQVNKLIFLYGNVSKDWVMERMNAALQLILRNNYPIEDIFIYMAPPHKEADDIKINQRLLKVNVVNSSEKAQVDGDVISKFFDDLKTSV
ncbi:TIR domain-containing protein [Flavobacteriaceae bacterium MAR_2010_188]|nr:TIR domain-containing protein [Flavobacteriaceae bacterium MAR_2010_188]